MSISPRVVTDAPRAPAPPAARRRPVSRGVPGLRGGLGPRGAWPAAAPVHREPGPVPLVIDDTSVINPSASRRESQAAARPPPSPWTSPTWTSRASASNRPSQVYLQLVAIQRWGWTRMGWRRRWIYSWTESAAAGASAVSLLRAWAGPDSTG